MMQENNPKVDTLPISPQSKHTHLLLTQRGQKGVKYCIYLTSSWSFKGSPENDLHWGKNSSAETDIGWRNLFKTAGRRSLTWTWRRERIHTVTGITLVIPQILFRVWTETSGAVFLFPKKRRSRPWWARHSALMPFWDYFLFLKLLT